LENVAKRYKKCADGKVKIAIKNGRKKKNDYELFIDENII
jgi:hypothetical protein